MPAKNVSGYFALGSQDRSGWIIHLPVVGFAAVRKALFPHSGNRATDKGQRDAEMWNIIERILAAEKGELKVAC